jgi:hypothetical protein
MTAIAEALMGASKKDLDKAQAIIRGQREDVEARSRVVTEGKRFHRALEESERPKRGSRQEQAERKKMREAKEEEEKAAKRLERAEAKRKRDEVLELEKAAAVADRAGKLRAREGAARGGRPPKTLSGEEAAVKVLETKERTKQRYQDKTKMKNLRLLDQGCLLTGKSLLPDSPEEEARLRAAMEEEEPKQKTKAAVAPAAEVGEQKERVAVAEEEPKQKTKAAVAPAAEEESETESEDVLGRLDNEWQAMDPVFKQAWIEESRRSETVVKTSASSGSASSSSSGWTDACLSIIS